MDDSILVTLNTEQADLIVRALYEFREKFYEQSRMDNEENTESVCHKLCVIDRLCYHLKIEIANKNKLIQ